MSETISLELAQRFKEAGIERPHKRVWSDGRGEREVVYKDPMRTPIKGGVPAYTAEELWARLPYHLNSCGLLRIVKDRNNITVCEYDFSNIVFEGPTLAEALGEMYIYLFTNGLIGKGEKPE